MRIAPVLVAAALAVPSVAVGDPAAPAEDDTRKLAGLFGLAMHHQEATALRDLFAAKVTVEGVEFADKACDKKFGKGKKRTVAKKDHAKLATCMIKAGWAVPEQPDSGTDMFGFTSRDGDAIFTVRVSAGKDGTLKIGELERGLVQRMVEVDGEADGAEGGVEGGIEGGYVPPPPPPPAPPQNVAPTTVEANRLTGTKEILPDDVTKTEMERASKTKVVASFKMCLTAAGRVSSVTQLKSSGFPSYDAKIKSEMRTWTYNAFVVNGKPAPVCTAVTFIYTVK